MTHVILRVTGHNFFKVQPCSLIWKQSSRAYAAKTKAPVKKEEDKKKPASTKKAHLNMEVCVGANIFKAGADPAIRPESEYPSWLWSLLEPKRSYLELSPNTKQYWRRYNKDNTNKANALKKALS
eukprot:Em0009g677a